MRTPSMNATPRSQRGAATIFITIVLLLAVALIALYTNRGAIMEQRLAANEVRSKQAFSAANAGIDAALAFWRGGGDPLAVTANPPISGTLDRAGTGNASYYRARFCSSAAAIPACPLTLAAAMNCGTAATVTTQVVVYSCGYSDDQTSVQRVSQVVGPSKSLAGTVSTPLIAKGTANLLVGGATVMNYFNDLTVWSGLSLLGQSNTGKTFTRDIVTDPYVKPTRDFRATGNSPACNNPPAGYSCSTQGSSFGHDTVTGDTNLSSKTADEFFTYTFGSSPDAYKNATAGTVVAAANAGTIAGLTQDSIWVEGNASLSGVIGSIAKPKLLIIHGDLNLGSNVEIHGTVYVTGNLYGNGNPTIYGALIVAGDANASGNLKIIYDPAAIGGTNEIGKPAKLPGTWRDW